MEDILESIQELTEEDKDFLWNYIEELKEQKLVKYHLSKYKKTKLYEKHKKEILFSCVVKYGDYRFLFEKQPLSFKPHIIKNKHGMTLQITDILEVKSHACLAHGLLNHSQPVIVKYYQKNGRSVEEESAIYVKMRQVGALLPWCSTTFHLLGQPILVLEKLESISQYDNEFKCGLDILQQLYYLHKRVGTCHSDLKLGNVMRIANTNQYTIIDLGGVPKEKVREGWIRRCYTPLVTSQKRHVPNQVMTEWHDLLELCYTLKMIQNLRDPTTACQRNKQNDYVRSGFTGKLKLCIDYIKSIEPTKIKDDVYHQLSLLFSQ